jgi:hypothetical protein
MHPYQEETIAPPRTRQKALSRPSATIKDRAVRIVREDGARFAQCPLCGERLTFGTATGRTVHAPSDLADLLVAEMSALEREELRVVLLNTRNRVVSVETVYMGNVSSSLVRIGELFTEAIRRQASSMILVHNHPTGDVTPSPDDLRLTAEALAAGRLLDVAVLDHLVIGGGTFVSLKDRGVAFGNPGDHRAGEARRCGPEGRCCHVETEPPKGRGPATVPEAPGRQMHKEKGPRGGGSEDAGGSLRLGKGWVFGRA